MSNEDNILRAGVDNDKEITILDASSFIDTLKESKEQLALTYVESKGMGAHIYRYVDLEALMNMISNGSMKVSINDIEMEDVPMTLEHTFDIKKMVGNKKMKDPILREHVGVDTDIGGNSSNNSSGGNSNGSGGSSSGGGGSASGSGENELLLIDATTFKESLEIIKNKLRATYVESKGKGAHIFKYLDYESFLYALENSIIKVRINNIHVEDVPATLEHTFDIEHYHASSTKKGNMVFVGDSRTICMFSATGDNTIQGEDRDGIKVYAGWGEGFNFLESAVASAGEFKTLITWIGCNDAGNGVSFSETYGPFYESLLEEDKNIVLFSVGRTDDRFLAEWDEGYANSNMISFNNEMMSWSEEHENVTYVDAYAESWSWKLNPSDGIHYTPRPTTSVWEFIKKHIPDPIEESEEEEEE